MRITALECFCNLSCLTTDSSIPLSNSSSTSSNSSCPSPNFITLKIKNFVMKLMGYTSSPVMKTYIHCVGLSPLFYTLKNMAPYCPKITWITKILENTPMNTVFFISPSQNYQLSSIFLQFSRLNTCKKMNTLNTID